MLLLSWHGTILRVDAAQSRLSQAPPIPVRPTGRDFVVEVPDGPLTLPLTIEGDITLVAAPQPGAVHLTRGGMYLSAGPKAAYPAFDRAEPRQWETFLPLTETEIALLRGVLATRWREAAAADAVEALTFALKPGFLLSAGALQLNLTLGRPALTRDMVLHLPLADGPRTLRPAGAAPPPPEILLCRKPAPLRRDGAASLEAFRATADSLLILDYGKELYVPPLTGSLADRDWLLNKSWPSAPMFGEFACRGRLAHDRDVFVLTRRGVEGMVFNTSGLLSEPGYLDNLTAPLPPHFAREGRDVFVSAAALQGAPHLSGPHAVFYGGNLLSLSHWLTGALVPLCMLAPVLPPDTTLLLPSILATAPAPAGAGYLDMLHAFGFGGMARVLVDAPLCLVDDLYRPEHLQLSTMPAAVLQAARARAFARLPAAGPATRRLFVRPDPPRDIANQAEIEALAKKRGLEVIAPAEMSFADVIEAFRHASLVVGMYGGRLSNILFCPPGTAVLELSPASAYGQQFSMLSSKLDLVHGILPCPTTTDNFNAKIDVDAARLRAMINFMELRAGAAGAAGADAES